MQHQYLQSADGVSLRVPGAGVAQQASKAPPVGGEIGYISGCIWHNYGRLPNTLYCNVGTNVSAVWTPIDVPVGPPVKGIPTGGCIVFPEPLPPTGFLACDGSAVSRTVYSDLFAVIGTQFGAGDGVTTFNVPDFRGIPPAT